MNKVVWYVLSVGEFWVAMWISMFVQESMPRLPLVLLVPAIWLVIHFGVPKLIGKEPLW